MRRTTATGCQSRSCCSTTGAAGRDWSRRSSAFSRIAAAWRRARGRSTSTRTRYVSGSSGSSASPAWTSARKICSRSSWRSSWPVSTTSAGTGSSGLSLLFAAVPAHRDPRTEAQIARHVQKQHEEEPPDLVGELEVLLLAQVHDNQVERHREHQEQDRRNGLEEDENQHGGHPTCG